MLRAAASNPCVSSTQCYFALRFLLNGKRIYAFMVAHLEKNKPLPNRCRRHRWMRHSPGIARAAQSRAPRRCRTVATVRQDPAVFLSVQCPSRRDNYRHPILRKISIEDGVGRARLHELTSIKVSKRREREAVVGSSSKKASNM